ncbi:methylated-DNA--[protein]-cysteine S-methyltransferase [Yinghuangia sp. ASG 101]|uniref:methylated-DNA--[protein]-cysteine S-methyltransferase n=1 Tax=Yinghuangia sp. ASG 101 TaxID=2896848 RepID=UPI002F91B241
MSTRVLAQGGVFGEGGVADPGAASDGDTFPLIMAAVSQGGPGSPGGPTDSRPRPADLRVPLAGPPRYAVVGSPVGELLLTGDGEALSGLFMLPDAKYVPEIGADWIRDETAFDAVRTQLDEYFAGERRAFDVPLAPRGTAFQRSVWRELTAIPYGRTMSYGAMAAALGTPTASRAVGAANGRNPISIIVPCHRVIASNGALTGYAGGLDRKRRLLALERGAAVG